MNGALPQKTLPLAVFRIYNKMLTWHEPKRQANIALHGLDFEGCERIWDRFTVTREDRRANYGEVRLVCFGVIHEQHVVLVYTERPQGPHIISLRKAVKHEIAYYRKIARQAYGSGA